VALLSALINKPVRGGTVVLGEMTIQGAILPIGDAGGCIQLVKENGGRRILLPVANAKDLAQIPGDLLSGLDIAFFADPRDCLLKAMVE
jgi:ATP-dependent Lon protease